MLHPDAHPPLVVRETVSWPWAVAFAVIGPLALAIALAVLAAISS